MTDRRLTPDDLYRLASPSDPQLSPDGTQVAYVVTTPDRETDGYTSRIWLAPTGVGAGEPIPLTSGPSASSPRWSPDGKTLAYVAPPAKDERPQVFLLPIGGGAARQLTTMPGGAGAPVWSPDGTAIAMAAGVDVIGGEPSAPVTIDRLGFKADGAGLIKGRRQHLFVADTDSGQTIQITWGDVSAGGPVWTPDSKRLAYSTGTGADRDLEPSSTLFVVDRNGGRSTRIVSGPAATAGQAAAPVFVDDSTLLYAGALTMAPGHTRLFTVPLAGGEPAEVTTGLDRNVMPGGPGYPGGVPQPGRDGTVLFCARDRGCTHVFTVPVAGGQATRTVGGWDRIVSGLSVRAAAGKLAYVAGTPASPGEVFVADLDGSNEHQVTDLAGPALAGIAVFTAEERSFTAPDGTEVHGWVVRDPEIAGPTPLLLDVHGGPHNSWGPTFDSAHLYHQALAAEGWTILYVNPRGSDGYGEAFYTAVSGEWGTSDLDDFLAPIDALVADGLVDPARIAVTGYSYGGFMTCWLTARTDRFAAAITGGCVSNLASMFGSSDVGYYLGLHEGGALPFEDAEKVRRHSPVTYVDAVTTPTLILHGENDDRCPVGQAEEWFAALRGRRVPAELVRYPGASHLFILLGRPTHRIDYCRRVADWAKAHTSGTATPRATALATRLRGYQPRFDALAKQFKVPGASLAVLDGDEVVTLATGVLSNDTKAPVTTDALFQIGSITKVFTTTLVMQLVDKGLVDLDAPVRTYLPDFELAEKGAAEQITVRHLLTHTSGIEGDHIVDFGRGDDCVARYVASLAEVGLIHPVGEKWSYSNSGFVVAGRLVEVLTGLPWDQALRQNLLQPLGIDTMLVLPEDIVLHPHAIGHVPDTANPMGDPVVASSYGTIRACAPAGSIPAARARDLLAFTRMHLDEGKAADGTEVLSAASVKLMQERQADVPGSDAQGLGSGWGLGWSLATWDGERTIGHGGGTLGQLSMLRVLPDRRQAVALLTNGPGGLLLVERVLADLFGQLAGIDTPKPPVPPAEPLAIDLAPYAGVYENIGSIITVSVGEGSLLAEMKSKIQLDPNAPPQPPQTVPLIPIDAATFSLPGGAGSMSFVDFDADGRPAYIFSGRLLKRVS